MLITVQLPRSAAAKLTKLEATPGSENLVTDLKSWLAAMASSGGHFAAAPPVCLTVAGGADLLARLDSVRSSIGRLTASINNTIVIAADTSALLDLEDHPAFDALVAYRLQLERQEEALVIAAVAYGLKVHRRSDADPRAVLELLDLDGLPTQGAA